MGLCTIRRFLSIVPVFRNSLGDISGASIPFYARTSRGEVLAVKEREFITAASGVGGSARLGERCCKENLRRPKRRKNP
jgi:hypothetical protein